MSGRDIKTLNESDADTLFNEPFFLLAAGNRIATIQFLGKTIQGIKKAVNSHVKRSPECNSLLTIPGIGTIRGLTIMPEVGDIRRFSKVDNYSS